jgi:hypothetical protein
MIEGMQMQVALFNTETGEMYPADVKFDEAMPNGDAFKAHGLSALKSMAANTSQDRMLNKRRLVVFPNPSEGIFNIRRENQAGFQNPAGLLLTWEITNIHGSVIATGREYANNFTVSISNHPKGIYYLKITQGGLQVVRKLVLQ